MKSPGPGFVVRSFVVTLLTLAVAQLPASRAEAGAKVLETDDFSLELGMRIQPRMELEWFSAGADAQQRDFMIRRARLKLNGKMQSASYGFEWKIDRTDQIGATPSAAVENAWIRYPLGGGVDLRAGLYDQPFSRDRLTSDSKQLAVDRGAVSDVPEALGLADNTVGLEVLGKISGGRAEYVVGLFDNVKIPGSLQDVPMVVGRLDLNFGSTKDVFQDAHFGKDKWYSVGLNGSYQGSLEDAGGASDGLRSAVGIDGMIDVPAGSRRVFAKGEADVIQTRPPAGGNTLDTKVWMLGFGVLVLEQRFQPFVRFDEIRLDDAVGGGVTDITYVGANFYQKGHSLKIQGDVRLQSGGESVDGARVQTQIDF